MVARLHVRNKPDKARLPDQRIIAGCTRCDHAELMIMGNYLRTRRLLTSATSASAALTCAGCPRAESWRLCVASGLPLLSATSAHEFCCDAGTWCTNSYFHKVFVLPGVLPAVLAWCLAESCCCARRKATFRYSSRNVRQSNGFQRSCPPKSQSPTVSEVITGNSTPATREVRRLQPPSIETKDTPGCMYSSSRVCRVPQ